MNIIETSISEKTCDFSNIKQIKKEKLNESQTNCTIKEKQKDSIKKKDRVDELLSINEVNKIIKKYNPQFGENFELLTPIKSGSAGAVHKAKEKLTKNQKLVACKILNDVIKKKNEKKIIRNHREIMIHRKLHFKNIPEVYGCYPLGPENSCIVMEYNKFGDLDNFKKNVIKRSFLSETLLCYISGHIIESLNYLNKMKIIHMDIKLQNILVDDLLNIKLTDYSVSINYENINNYINLPLFGTCYYMSPEVLEKRQIDIKDASKIDIYSFGVLIYLLAFNDYPYELDNVDPKNYSGILKNIKEKNLVFPKDTGHSETFKKFLSKCLEKDIKNRYDIYQIMKDPWIKGYQLILNQKENFYNAGKFLIDLMIDGFKNFNDYIKSQEDF